MRTRGQKKERFSQTALHSRGSLPSFDFESHTHTNRHKGLITVRTRRVLPVLLDLFSPSYVSDQRQVFMTSARRTQLAQSEQTSPSENESDDLTTIRLEQREHRMHFWYIRLERRRQLAVSCRHKHREGCGCNSEIAPAEQFTALILLDAIMVLRWADKAASNKRRGRNAKEEGPI
jgi:hypothetical protein